MKYAVQAADFSEAIHVGRLNKAQTAFTDKEDATDMVLFEVARYVECYFGGGLEATYPNAGLKVSIRVEQIWKTASDE